jgi:hypothetical protein
VPVSKPSSAEIAAQPMISADKKIAAQPVILRD